MQTETFATYGSCPECDAPMNIDARGKVGEPAFTKRVIEDGSYVGSLEFISSRKWRPAPIATCTGCEFATELSAPR